MDYLDTLVIVAATVIGTIVIVLRLDRWGEVILATVKSAVDPLRPTIVVPLPKPVTSVLVIPQAPKLEPAKVAGSVSASAQIVLDTRSVQLPNATQPAKIGDAAWGGGWPGSLPSGSIEVLEIVYSGPANNATRTITYQALTHTFAGGYVAASASSPYSCITAIDSSGFGGEIEIKFLGYTDVVKLSS